uniref:Eukaryotic translation initiation factor 4B n=1 Tax=Gorilla gorilla gorilla TaxID=9595 RepID=A0A2I2Z1Y0_GORGO
VGASQKRRRRRLSLTYFLAEDGRIGGGSSYVSKPVPWADETDDLVGDVSTTWHSSDDDVYRVPPIDRSILPTAPRAAREPNIDRLPKSPPYTAFLGNLSYDMTEESIKELFRGLNISAVRLPHEPSNPERLKGFDYAEIEDLDSLLSSMSLNEESLGNRKIQVDVADQAQGKDREDRSFGHDRNRDSDKTDTDWRARPATDNKYRDSYDSDRYHDGYQDGQDRYDDQGSTDYDRRYDSRIGSGRRAFGSGCHRDDDYRGGGTDRQDDRSWNSRDDYSRDDYMGDDRGPSQRPKLTLKPRSAPKEDDSSASTSQSSRGASIFGGAKPVDTAAREREVEEQLQKEHEKLQHQLDEPKLERRPRERHPKTQEREQLRTGSESLQTGTSTTSGRNARRRVSEKSLENETLNKEEDCHSPTSKPPKPDQSLKVMPAPPPKENGWVNSDTEQQSPTIGLARKDENEVDGMNIPKGQTGNSSHGPGEGGNKDHSKESDRKDDKKDKDSRSAPEPNKPEENPASKFSSARKYAALSIDAEETSTSCAFS